MRYLFADFSLDTDRRELRRDGDLLDIEPKVFDVLAQLIASRDRVVGKNDLIAAVWGNRIVSDSTLTTCINAVRRAVGDNGKAQGLIRTLPRKGFRFVGDVQEGGHVAVAVSSAPKPVLPLPDKPSIAVLPFQNLSGEADQEYFADGVVEDIITALSHVPWLFVIARNSSFTYKGRAVDVKQVGHELGVRYVVEGSIRRAANRVRITGQLIETATGAQVWADRFEGSLEDIFEMQDQMTGRIVNALLPTLIRTEKERARRKPTESLDAYELYLRAMAIPATRETIDESIALYLRATELDPKFGAAYGLAAYNYALRSKVYRWNIDTNKDIVEVARLARRAIAVAPHDAVAVGCAGMAIALVVGDLDAGAMYVGRALTLNPSSAQNWQHSGWINIWLDRLDVAIEHLQQAMRLSPLDPFSFAVAAGMAFAHYFAGDYDEAHQWAEKALYEAPAYHIALGIGSAAAAMAGRPAEAARLCSRLQAVDPELRLSNIQPMLAPYRNPEHPERWIEGLRRAGLPE